MLPGLLFNFVQFKLILVYDSVLKNNDVKNYLFSMNRTINREIWTNYKRNENKWINTFINILDICKVVIFLLFFKFKIK